MPKKRKFENVFVLCPGRVGSMTFTRACEYFTNYSAAHESRIKKLGDSRIDYPVGHIEVDNRLSWFLGRLDEKYGDKAFYVHLTRDPEEIAQSYNRRWAHAGGIVSGFSRSIILSQEFGIEQAREMVATVEENIAHFLKQKTNVMTIDITEAKSKFKEFAKQIGASGDIEAACAEFDEKHNISENADNDDKENSVASNVLVKLHDLILDRNRSIRSLNSDLIKASNKNATLIEKTDSYAVRIGSLESELKAERDNATKKLGSLESELKAERDNATKKQAALESELKAERDNATKKQAALESELKAERDNATKKLGSLESELKAERDNATKKLGSLEKELKKIPSLLSSAYNSGEKNVRRSKKYRVGDSLDKAIRSPIDLLKLPVRLFRISRLKHEKVPVPSFKVPSIHAISNKATPALKRKFFVPSSVLESKHPNIAGNYAFNVLQELFVNGEESARNKLLDYSRNSYTHSFKHILSMYTAETDHDWTSSLNTWLNTYGASPVKLLPGKQPRFFRLSGTKDVKLENGPKVSVIMPAYNCEDTLELSTRSILQQTWKNIELIIINDNSQDNTLELARKIEREDPRVKVLHNHLNVGPYVSKNRALEIATGEYITGHDADDWAIQNRIECQMRELKELNQPAICGNMLRLNSDGFPSHPAKVGPFSIDGIQRRASISLLIEKKFLTNYLGFWDQVRFGADSEFIGRVDMALERIGNYSLTSSQVTMLCLDHADSLTNDGTTGVNKSTGVSSIRKSYRDGYLAWHKSLSGKSLFLDFPQEKRIIEAPEKMQVSYQDINEALRSK